MSLARLPNNAVAPKAMPRKMAICRHWVKGYCQLGLQCGFAHGPDEIGAPRDGNAAVMRNLANADSVPQH